MTGIAALRPVLLAVTALGVLSGCGPAYYLQAVSGHLEILRKAQPVERLLADPATPEALAERLELAREALSFAHDQLLLPDNGSYRRYADIGRPYVVWNVVAAPEFSLIPQQWCFPVAGCLPYRGYFSAAGARRFADGLAGRGLDVHVGGVSAYSTLGRLADPLLNTMLAWPEADFVALIFHELAHQRVYVRDDAAFNEGFASFVEREGLRRFLLQTGREALLQEREQAQVRRAQVMAILQRLRAALEVLYAGAQPPAEQRAAKARLIEAARSEYAALAATWDEGPRFAGLLPPTLNNATLAALATYEDQVPAFARLLAQSGGDLAQFYAAVDALAALPPAARQAALSALHDPPVLLR